MRLDYFSNRPREPRNKSGGLLAGASEERVVGLVLAALALMLVAYLIVLFSLIMLGKFDPAA